MSTMDAYDFTQLTAVYDKTQFTLTITSDAGNIDQLSLRDIYFGNSAEDLNICDKQATFYHTKDYKPVDLTKKNQAEVVLQSDSAALKDLKLTFSLLETGVLSMNYTFNDLSKTTRKIFTVPEGIINPGRDKLLKDGDLSKYVTVDQEAKSSVIITVMNDASVPVFQLTGFALTEYFNLRVGQVYTLANSPGILGLGEQVTDDIYVKDGVYGFWSRDVGDPKSTSKLPTTNMYGTHPFFMGQGTDSNWFGVFTNLAAAQEWWVTNHKDTGIVDLTTAAAGGVMDMFFMFGKNPNEVVTKYHTGVVGKPVLTPSWILGWNQCRWGYTST